MRPVSHCDAAEKIGRVPLKPQNGKKICKGVLKATEIYPLNRDKFKRHDISASVSTVTTSQTDTCTESGAFLASG